MIAVCQKCHQVLRKKANFFGGYLITDGKYEMYCPKCHNTEFVNCFILDNKIVVENRNCIGYTKEV